MEDAPRVWGQDAGNGVLVHGDRSARNLAHIWIVRSSDMVREHVGQTCAAWNSGSVADCDTGVHLWIWGCSALQGSIDELDLTMWHFLVVFLQENYTMVGATHSADLNGV